MRSERDKSVTFSSCAHTNVRAGPKNELNSAGDVSSVGSPLVGFGGDAKRRKQARFPSSRDSLVFAILFTQRFRRVSTAVEPRY